VSHSDNHRSVTHVQLCCSLQGPSSITIVVHALKIILLSPLQFYTVVQLNAAIHCMQTRTQLMCEVHAGSPWRKASWTSCLAFPSCMLRGQLPRQLLMSRRQLSCELLMRLSAPLSGSSMQTSKGTVQICKHHCSLFKLSAGIACF